MNDESADVTCGAVRTPESEGHSTGDAKVQSAAKKQRSRRGPRKKRQALLVEAGRGDDTETEVAGSHLNVAAKKLPANPTCATDEAHQKSGTRTESKLDRAQLEKSQDVLRFRHVFMAAARTGSLEDLDTILADPTNASDLENTIRSAWEELRLLNVPLPYQLEWRITSFLIDLRYRLSCNKTTQSDVNNDNSREETAQEPETDVLSKPQTTSSETNNLSSSPSSGGNCSLKRKNTNLHTNMIKFSEGEAMLLVKESEEPLIKIDTQSSAIENTSVKHAQRSSLKSSSKCGTTAFANQKTALIRSKHLTKREEKHARKVRQLVSGLIRSLGNLIKKSEDDVDDEWNLLSHFTVQDIQEVKHLLKSTYHRLPWEEIEFILICFIGCSKQDTTLTVHNIVLSKAKVLVYLREFKARLEQLLNESDVDWVENKYPKDDRREVIQMMQKDWGTLYEDYYYLRNVRSLQSINHYLNLTQISDLPSVFLMKLVIERALQVTGEMCKDTWTSPRLTEEIRNKVIHMAPEYVLDTLKTLRNKLSKIPVETETSHQEMKELQQDLNKLQRSVLKLMSELMIRSILDSQQWMCNYSNSHKVLHYLRGVVTNPTPSPVKYQGFERTLEQLSTLAEDDEKSFVERIWKGYFEDAIGSDQIILDYAGTLETLLGAMSWFDEKANLRIMQTVKTRLYELSDDLQSRAKVVKATMFAFNGLRGRSSTSLRLLDVLRKGLQVDNMYSTCDLDDALHESRETKSDQEKQSMVAEFTRTLVASLPHESFIAAESAEQHGSCLQILAAIERVLLDVAGVWSEGAPDARAISETCSPALFGRPLRNYLAHGNAMMDDLSYNPKLELMLLTIKLIGSHDDGPAIDLARGASQRPPPAAPVPAGTHGEERCRRRLRDVVEAKCATFRAAKEGRLDEVLRLLREGMVVVEARDCLKRTLLHVAAMSGKGQLVRRMLKDGLSPHSTDRDGRTPLHYATSVEVYDALLQAISSVARESECEAFAEDSAGTKATAIDDCSFPDQSIHFLQATDPSCSERLTGENYGRNSSLPCPDKADVYSILALAVSDSCGRLPLHAAAESGLADVVEAMMKALPDDIRGLFLLKADHNDWTPLHVAVAMRHESVVRLLLEAGKSAGIHAHIEPEPPLHLAATAGTLAVAEMLLGSGAEPRATSESGMTALMMAAAHGNTAVANYLINLSDITAVDKDGLTVVHLAARSGCVEVVDTVLDFAQLLEREVLGRGGLAAETQGEPGGPKLLHTLDHHGRTALHYAAEFGHLGVAQSLVKRGVRHTLWDGDHMTALHLAARHGHAHLVDFLAEVRTCAGIGQPEGPSPPLCLAAANGYVDVVLALTEPQKGGVSVMDENGYTALHHAVMAGHVRVVEALLDVGACPACVRHVNGETPLHSAAVNNRAAVAVTLLEHASSLCERCREEENAELQRQLGGEAPAYGRWMPTGGVGLGHGTQQAAPTAPLKPTATDARCFVADGHSGTGKGAGNFIPNAFLLEREDFSERPPLLRAACMSTETMDVMLRAGADWRHTCSNGTTALHAAANCGTHSAVRGLISWVRQKAGADLASFVNGVDTNGFTALHLAAENGDRRMVRSLLKAGSKVDARNKQGYTAIHHALCGDHGCGALTEVLDWWPEDGGSLSTEGSSSGPLMLATHLGHVEGVRLLLERRVYWGPPSAASVLGIARLSGKDAIGDLFEKHGVSLDDQRRRIVGLGGLILQVNGYLESLADAAPGGEVPAGSGVGTARGGESCKDEAAVSSETSEVDKGAPRSEGAQEEASSSNGTASGDGNTATEKRPKPTAGFKKNLREAVVGNDVCEVAFLVTRGERMDVDLGDGQTALDVALEQRKDKIGAVLVKAYPLSWLLETTCDFLGHTVLEAAVQSDMHCTVAALLDAGVPLSGKVCFCHSLITHAAFFGFVTTLDVLISHAVRLRISTDAETRDVNSEQRALQEVIKAEQTVSIPLMMYLVRSGGELTGFSYLLERQVPPDMSRDWRGRSPLLEAARWGKLKFMELLLRHGADPLQSDAAGHTALHLAAIGGHPTAARALTRHCPAVLAATNKDGMTALHVAASRAHFKPQCGQVVQELTQCLDSDLPQRISEAKMDASCILKNVQNMAPDDYFHLLEELHFGDPPDSACVLQ